MTSTTRGAWALGISVLECAKLFRFNEKHTYTQTCRAPTQVNVNLQLDCEKKNVLEIMQTREDLYKYLGYHEYEQKLDDLFAQEEES